MPKDLAQLLVVDVEATCWQGPRPPDQESEIIEIGLCLVDVATLARVERRSILVRPERSVVTPFCTELTTPLVNLKTTLLFFATLILHHRLFGADHAASRLLALAPVMPVVIYTKLIVEEGIDAH